MYIYTYIYIFIYIQSSSAPGPAPPLLSPLERLQRILAPLLSLPPKTVRPLVLPPAAPAARDGRHGGGGALRLRLEVGGNVL